MVRYNIRERFERWRKDSFRRREPFFFPRSVAFSFLFFLLGDGPPASYTIVPGIADSIQDAPRLNTVIHPLSGEPKLTAHVMMNMQPGHLFHTDPDENFRFPVDPSVSPAHIGGFYINRPLYAYYNQAQNWQRPEIEHLKHEIRMAHYMSIDAFMLTVNFKLETDPVRAAHMRVLSGFFEAARQLREEEGIVFYISLEFCNTAPELEDVNSRLNNAVLWMKELFDAVSPYGQEYGEIWLKDPEGNLVFNIYNVLCPLEITQVTLFNRLRNSSETGDAAYNSYHETLMTAFDFWYSLEYWLTDSRKGIFRKESAGGRFRYVPRIGRFESLKVSTAAAYTQSLTWYIDRYANEFIRRFPGVSYWKPFFYDEDIAVVESILQQCTERSFVSSIWADHANDKYRLASDPSVVIQQPSSVSPEHVPEDVARRCHPPRGAELLLNCWERVVSLPSPGNQLAQIITWNDYGEGHQFAPTLSKNFGYHYINKWFKEYWTTGFWPEAGTEAFPETAIVFFHKYHHSAVPEWYPTGFFLLAAELPEHEWNKMWAAADVLQVVSILSGTGQGVQGQPVGAARVHVRGVDFTDIASGLQVCTVPLTPSDQGPVRVRIYKQHGESEEAMIDFTAHEWLTDRPYRHDFGMYVQSSEWQNLYDLYFDPDLAGVLREPGTYRILDEYVIEEGQTEPNYRIRYSAPAH